jgi:hypothetical protein
MPKTFNYIAMGKFTDSPFMSLLTNDGIYFFNSTDFYNVYNYTDRKTYQLPISLMQKTAYSNDIIRVASDATYLYLITSQAAMCGDGVCSPFENPLTCPTDCFNINATLPVSALFSVNDFCMSDMECSTGFCDVNKCSLKTGNMDCNLNAECLSNSCSHEKCTDAGISSNFQNMIKNLFGFNAGDGVLFYLIIAGIIFLIGIGASIYTVHYIPAVASIVFDIIILICFTFIGITPAWLLLVTIILCFIIAFILFMIVSRQS